MPNNGYKCYKCSQCNGSYRSILPQETLWSACIASNYRTHCTRLTHPTPPTTHNFFHILKCQFSVRKRPTMNFHDLLWPSMTFYHLLRSLWPSMIVKPKSSPKSKSQIQVRNPGPISKSQIQNPRSRSRSKDWDWGWHYNPTGHHHHP